MKNIHFACTTLDHFSLDEWPLLMFLKIGGPPLDDLDEEMSKDVTDDENNVTSNSSEGQR